MARNKHLGEYVLLLVNRGAVPATTFVALAVFRRVMSHSNFETFLLALSLNQWILAFGFQWQKNAAVRFYHYERYRRVSLLSLSVVIFIAAVFYIFFAYFTQLSILIGGLLYTLVAGVLYYTSTNYRMRGSVATYANVDTAFQVIRWAVAIGAVLLIPSADSPFWGAALAVVVALIVYSVMSRGHPGPDGPPLTWRQYLSAGLWLALFDFAGAGMMYVDRFYVQNADYVLHSTVSNQIGSVLFGALIATAYPRIVLSWREGGNAWRREFRRLAKFILPLLILTPALCAAAGPILLHILSPMTKVNYPLLVTLGLCQSFHHVIYFTSIILILISKNYICGCAYLCCFVFYTSCLFLFAIHDWLAVASIKCAFLGLTLVGVAITTYSLIRRPEAYAAKN